MARLALSTSHHRLVDDDGISHSMIPRLIPSSSPVPASWMRRKKFTIECTAVHSLTDADGLDEDRIEAGIRRVRLSHASYVLHLRSEPAEGLGR